MSSIQTPVFIVRVLLVLAVAILVIQVARTEDGKHSSTPASKRLMRELKDFHESTSYKDGIFTVELVDDNIYEWNIKIFKPYPPSSYRNNIIYKRWKERTGKDHFLLHAAYDDKYPFVPPFIKIVYPKLSGISSGWICHELLTSSGWNSAYTIEPLILQIMDSLDRGIAGKDDEQYEFDISERTDYENWMNEAHPHWFE
uniref:Ubiquitin-conjugating enzyme E2 Q1 n=1 Tax=Aceria tosichella TaxID=561515 RepID=A0A6G1SLT2_9ACAR